MSAELTGSAPAKVNLFLRVLSREEDGYHGIETLFCRLALADILTAERTQGREITLEVEGAETGPVEDNLVVRAARAVLEASREKFGVRFKLTKRTPVGAGLGGGSADGALALSMVNQLTGNPVPRSELLHFASRLGSDLPFCLSGVPLALAWGHGDRMLSLPPLPAAPVLLVSPAIAIPTAEAYRWVDEVRRGAGKRGALALEPGSLASWSDVARMAGNDFESAIFGKYPAIREAFEALARTRPALCRMTGSGSTLFAVYRSETDREDARMMLGKKYGRVIVTATVGREG